MASVRLALGCTKKTSIHYRISARPMMNWIARQPRNLLALGLVVVIPFAAFNFCGIQTAQASPGKAISSPGTFKDDFGSHLASDGVNLWLAVVGLNRTDELRTQVFVRQKEGWRQLPGHPLSTTHSTLKLEALRIPGQKRSVPCLGDEDEKEVSRIRCFKRGRWHQIPFARSLRGMYLAGLSAEGTKLTALFSDLGGKPQALTARVARLKHGRIVPFGPPLKVKGSGTANLGSKTSGTNSTDIEVAVETFDERWVATLGSRGWTRSEELPFSEIGSQWGTVRSGEALFYPVMTVTRNSDWPFLIYREQDNGSWAELPDSPLNVGTGKAQGILNSVGNRVWAVWQQHGDYRKDGLASTQMYAALLDRDGEAIEKKIPLWKGWTIGPGSLQVVKYRGRSVFLYPRQFGPKGGLHATVDFSAAL